MHSETQNLKNVTPFVTSRTHKMRKNKKEQEKSRKWLFESKNEHGQYFWGKKTDDKVKNSKFKNLDFFCDVTDPQNDPKWSENRLKCQKTRQNDCLDLKMSMGNLSGEEKQMIKSKIQNSVILIPFVTSRTPKMTQNGPKITLNARKLGKMIVWI